LWRKCKNQTDSYFVHGSLRIQQTAAGATVPACWQSVILHGGRMILHLHNSRRGSATSVCPRARTIPVSNVAQTLSLPNATEFAQGCDRTGIGGGGPPV